MSQDTSAELLFSDSLSSSTSDPSSSSSSTTTADLPTGTPPKPAIKELEDALNQNPLLPTDPKALPETSQELPSDKTIDEQYFKQQLSLAEIGDAIAQYKLGECYATGRGVEKDDAKALEWLGKAAAQGQADAQFALGVCHEEGYVVEKDEAKAVGWYEKAAAQGQADAQYNLGRCYRWGFGGIAKNEAKAMEWYEKAAEQGQTDAQHSLSLHYLISYEMAKDKNKAIEWYEKAAKAVKWSEKIAVQGDKHAQHILGQYYKNGLGVAKDETKAAEWYEKAAKQENADAQYTLGQCYEYGHGVGKDEAKAVVWYEKAAVQGNRYALYTLGRCYEYGHGVVKNQTKAAEWYEKAAAQGYASAQRILGWRYLVGYGVVKDENKAVEWYEKAAAQGNTYAQAYLTARNNLLQALSAPVVSKAEVKQEADGNPSDQEQEEQEENVFEEVLNDHSDQVPEISVDSNTTSSIPPSENDSSYETQKSKQTNTEAATVSQLNPEIQTGDNTATTHYKTEETIQDEIIWPQELPPERRVLAEALFAAVQKGDAETVQKLIAQGAPPSVKRCSGSILDHAIWRNTEYLFLTNTNVDQLGIINALLTTSEGRRLVSWINRDYGYLYFGRIPLHVAAMRGEVEVVKALLATPEGRMTVNQIDQSGQTPLAHTADAFSQTYPSSNLQKYFDTGVVLLKHGANFQEVEDSLISQSVKKFEEYGFDGHEVYALTVLRLTYKRYQAELAASTPTKAETKQNQDGDASTLSYLDTSSNTLSSSSSSSTTTSLDTPPETKESKQSETQSVKNTSSKAEIRELFDLDSFDDPPSIGQQLTQEPTSLQAEISELTTSLQAGDTAALSEALAVPVEQQSEPLQHYLQSQAIWTVLDSEAKPAHKSAQIALLAEAPGVSLLVENEQGQLPLDVALQQLAEGQINKAAVQKLQDATQQQRAEEDEEVLQAIEIYAQTAPTGILEEKSSARPGESKSTTDTEDGPITPRQLAAEIQKYHATEESLQQEFKVLFAPRPLSATPSSQQSRQLSKQQRNSQKNAFQKMVHQLVSKKFITSVGVGQGWVEEVSTKKAAVAKAGATFLVGTAMNIVLPAVGGVVASGGKALIEKGYSERQKALSRKHTFGITSLKQLAMVTNHIEQCLLHRYQDFLLQQNLLLSKKAMKTFIDCLIERMCLYVEKIDEPEEIIPLLSEKLVNLNKWKKTSPVAAQNTPFTDAMAAQVAENLVAGTSLLHLGLIDSVKDKVRSSTDALITCLATDGSEKELHVHDICHSPVVTLTAEAEKASFQPNAISSDLAYEGRHLPGSQWSAGNCGVVCISRKEAEIENLHMTTQWDGSLPISNTQSDVVRLQARVNELEQQLAAERTKTAVMTARMTAPHPIESMPGDSKQSVFQSQKGPGMFGNSAGVGKPVRMPPPVSSFVAGEPESPVQPNSDEASGSVSSTRMVTEIPAGSF